MYVGLASVFVWHTSDVQRYLSYMLAYKWYNGVALCELFANKTHIKKKKKKNTQNKSVYIGETYFGAENRSFVMT